MSKKIIQLAKTTSTNTWLKNYMPAPHEDVTVVVADYQTAGRGQGTNRWESAAGKNLLFSVLIHPWHVPISHSFLLSMVGALAIKTALATEVPNLELKWPNDIYWHDRKLSGTLIETVLSGSRIKDCIFGIGLNVNQCSFLSDAPNPVSLQQILGRETDRMALLQRIVNSFEQWLLPLQHGEYKYISAHYHEALYRRNGFYTYRDAGGEFDATIVRVEADGHLVLCDRQGRIRTYAFKEVEVVLPASC